MNPGFDVCLHNKRLDLNVGANAPKTAQQPEAEQPASHTYVKRVMSGCNRLYKPQASFAVTTWSAYMILAVSLLHVGLLMWYLPPPKLGSAARNSVLFLTPCLLVRDLSILSRLHALIAHGAGVYALVFHATQDDTLSISFYAAAFFTVLTLILFRTQPSDSKTSSQFTQRIRDCIDILSLLALVLQIIFKSGKLVSEFALDAILIITVFLVYVSKYIPL